MHCLCSFAHKATGILCTSAHCHLQSLKFAMHADLQDVDEDEAAAQRQAERQRQEDDLDPLEDEDEFADFLVDDEEGEKTGEPRRRRRALAKALPAGVSAEAFQASTRRSLANACMGPMGKAG